MSEKPHILCQKKVEIQMKLHAACKLFPLLPDHDLRLLADDILANGLQNPIVMFEGKILDGQNRLAACELVKIKPKFTEFKGEAPLEWVISQNLMRRHLTTSQRAVLGFELLPLLEREAKKRQRLSNGSGKVGKKFPTLNGRSVEFAARITKTNSKYVQIIKSISTSSPKMIKKIKSGELTVLEAQKLNNPKPTKNKKKDEPDKVDHHDVIESLENVVNHLEFVRETMTQLVTDKTMTQVVQSRLKEARSQLNQIEKLAKRKK